MSEIKIQYLFKHKKDGDFQSETLTLEEIEAKDFGDYLRVWKMDGYKLVARRRFSGLRDKNGVEIYEGDIVRLRIAARDQQTHYGDNIPSGIYTEPMEPKIIEEIRVVKFRDGMFTLFDEDEDEWPLPLCWDLEKCTYKTKEDLMRGFEGGWGIYDRRGHETDWKDDLEYFKEEYGLDGVDAIMAYMGVEVIGNVWEVSQ